MKLFSDIQPISLIYHDIETVPIAKEFGDLSERLQNAWINKCKSIDRDKTDWDHMDYEAMWVDKAALYPEFAKIVCAVFGSYNERDEFKTVSYHGSDEVEILKQTRDLLNHKKYRSRKIAAHNGKGFDFPFLVKRYMIKGMKPPAKLWTYGKKPWEITELVDTKDLWKLGSYGSIHTSSLDTICAVFDIPSPKEDMDGSMVGKVYYSDLEDTEKSLEKISKYCTNDVIALAMMVARMFQWEDSPADDLAFIQ